MKIRCTVDYSKNDTLKMNIKMWLTLINMSLLNAPVFDYKYAESLPANDKRGILEIVCEFPEEDDRGKEKSA